jgi:hypothetical protein
MEESTLEIA